MYARFINWFSATSAGSWVVKHVASKLDPVWPEIKKTIPQMNVYETRTDRNIRVFRISRDR